MEARLTRDFTCYPPDTPGKKTTFAKGDKVEGKIAEQAIDRGAAEEIKPVKQKTKAAKAAPENK